MKIDFEYLEKNISAHIEKQFSSKKNSVYLLNYNGEKTVAKVFNNSRSKFEFDILNFLYSNGIYVPEPYAIVNQTIFMEYLEGDTLMNLINSNLTNKEKYMESLSDFFSSIHQIQKNKMSLLKGDSSIKNFIYNTKIYGIDFEESNYGNCLKDLAGAIAQILDSNPSFNDEKFYLSNYLLQKYSEKNNIDFNQIKVYLKDFLIKSLLFDSSFRPNQRKEIITWVVKIRKDFDQIFGK
ncbi:MAG: bifunctional UGMP family protein/serine/threonine protein kinase [Candidatus Methanofastidiosum methylothiophilum]|uniref:non-specific serine/threonine protein kinase n=1 Tax=Candidatus Methanofastidiosum methylothiophilum TaxID=1705564 RepID=A0A150IXM0_9EURY|nr:MAG: bifunctional UGMP family protein/serine/threonine protein kinase [Candidatus Methanofastidiosum methylthiophilus]KYC47296.1 MAG: bifunctional UGMP family protein/serine/threonine protein kinase [Candidatus Methanofastidiosum methylthiophilus]KYC49747.1 MAG: bifunctional UGMP family protein/serine/threonine protein kinase [Candidatus Methanofastidiosum methylthiophilus]